MHLSRNRWSWIALLLLVVAGCKTAEPELKPPPRPEEYFLPPDAEARYSKPIAFPDGTPKTGRKTFADIGNPLNDPSTRFQSGRTGARGY